MGQEWPTAALNLRCHGCVLCARKSKADFAWRIALLPAQGVLL